MATMKNLHAALLDADIDPDTWARAVNGEGDFSDFMLAAAVAKALGFERGAGWTSADFEEALSTAVERWPAGSAAA